MPPVTRRFCKMMTNDQTVDLILAILLFGMGGRFLYAFQKGYGLSGGNFWWKFHKPASTLQRTHLLWYSIGPILAGISVLVYGFL